MAHRLDEEEHRPAEQEIQNERKPRELVPEEYLVEDAYDGDEPYHSEGNPALNVEVVFDQFHADGGVAASYEQIDAQVVEQSEHALALGVGSPEVIERRGDIHQHHAHGEERSAKCHLPVLAVAQPQYDPCHRHGEA